MRSLFRSLALMALVPLVVLPATWAGEQKWEPLSWEKDYLGWRRVRTALADGKGDEFVRRLGNLRRDNFNGETELEAVRRAALWFSLHAVPRQIPPSYGLALGAADTIFQTIQTGFNPKAPLSEATFSILLCSALRFHTAGGLPPDRVFVALNLQPHERLKHRVTVQKAWVLYRSPDQKWWHILPQYGEGKYTGNPPEKFSTELPVPENLRDKTVLIYFNDQKVRTNQAGQQLLQADEKDKDE